MALLFPFYCMLYIIAPETKSGKLMRKPFMKFLIHASSYLFFLCKYIGIGIGMEFYINFLYLVILILVSQRAEDHIIELFGPDWMKEGVLEKYKRQRGNPPMALEYVVLLYVIGIITTHKISN